MVELSPNSCVSDTAVLGYTSSVLASRHWQTARTAEAKLNSLVQGMLEAKPARSVPAAKDTTTALPSPVNLAEIMRGRSGTSAEPITLTKARLG